MRTLRRLDRLADKLAGKDGRRAPGEAFEAYVAALDARSDRGDGKRV
jgi:hypothetical protein